MTSTADVAAAKNQGVKQNIRLDVADNGIATITIDLPDARVNTLGKDSMMQLNEAIDQLAGKSVRGLLIVSGKEDNFIAGADVNEIQSLQNKQQMEAYEAAQMGKRVFERLDKLPYPVVAAIN